MLYILVTGMGGHEFSLNSRSDAKSWHTLFVSCILLGAKRSRAEQARSRACTATARVQRRVTSHTRSPNRKETLLACVELEI
jgi:hypothetical protein